MASSKTFEDLDLSREEIKRIENALKDEKFRKMFVEYAEEISNPENRKIYEEEIAMLEKERGMDVQFVNPQPGHVLKTTVDGKKSFINICTNDKMGKPSSERKVVNGQRGLHWQIPHSFSPPREDYDKTSQKCMVYDVIFHPDTYTMCRNDKFQKLVEDTATEGIEKQFGVKVDRNNIRRPKLKYKGQPVATIIRNRREEGQKESLDKEDPLKNMPYPYGNKTSSELAEAKAKEVEKREKDKANRDSKTKSNIENKQVDGYTVPKYTITHRSHLDIQEYRNAPDARPTTRPKELVVSIELPLCKSAAGVDLDIFEERLTLKCEKPAYQLDMKLPYPVDDENGSARFDKSKSCLIVTLPVVPGDVPQMPTFIDEASNQNPENDLPPLIEELPPLEAPLVEELPPLEDLDDGQAVEDKDHGVEKEQVKEIGSPKSKLPPISYTLPQFDYNQDSETVTFVFHVKNVKDDSVCKSFPGDGNCEIKFISLGSGGFPMHYCLYMTFGEECKLVPEHCTVDISDKNMTFTLLKAKSSRQLWDKFATGVDKNTTEEKLFLTTSNLQIQLDQLQADGEDMGRTDARTLSDLGTEVKVTQMNEKKLKLKIQKPTKLSYSEEEEEEGLSEDECPSSAGIEVVHSKAPPNLQGILKQRSVSESSLDGSLSSGDSPTSISPRGDSDGGCKRGVTFNNYVDKATFKSNATVSSMCQVLKSKRRRNRKKEARKGGSCGRRRHNSTGSECSSCDEHDTRLSSESHSEEEHMEGEHLTEQLEQTGKKVENCGIIPEDDNEVDEGDQETKENEVKNSVNNSHKAPGYQIHSESKKDVKKASKLASEVKSKMAVKKGESTKADSDDDVDDDDGNVDIDDKDVSRTLKAMSDDHLETRDENQQKAVNKTSGSVDKKGGNSTTANDLNGDTNGSQVNSGETTEKGDNGGGAIRGDNPKSRKKGGSKKGVRFSEGEKEGKNGEQKSENSTKGQGESEGKPEEKAVSVKSDVETELSWREPNRESPFNLHKTQCAFDFSNAVMFDLDVD